MAPKSWLKGLSSPRQWPVLQLSEFIIHPAGYQGGGHCALCRGAGPSGFHLVTVTITQPKQINLLSFSVSSASWLVAKIDESAKILYDDV